MLVIIRDFLFFICFISVSYFSFGSEVIFTKTVTNITQASEASTVLEGRPGDVIEYNIDLFNGTDDAISNIQLVSAVPPFTVLAAVINCNNSDLPSTLRCDVRTPDGVNQVGYQGAIRWQLVGKLGVGHRARVSYQVIIK
ncbi:hypothetical protein [Photobacterium andalusiense]|uniref:DUF11 domain-containing protein n=1 Tax=Photobacterium andalusiense TaxID=2204296 RepID=A0A1Y6MFP8_9GAMM|nr:hypothetical protein [Photobacterium andalusiense]SMY35366.1 hypothetical protein PAND9192_02039 [Photobacterium andalusiense]